MPVHKVAVTGGQAPRGVENRSRDRHAADDEFGVVGTRHVRRYEDRDRIEYIIVRLGLTVIPEVVLDTGQFRRVQPLRQQYDVGHVVQYGAV